MSAGLRSGRPDRRAAAVLALGLLLLAGAAPAAPGVRPREANREANHPPGAAGERPADAPTAGAAGAEDPAAARERAAARDALRDAYEKEYAYLEAEKHALERRQAELRRETHAKERQARAEVERLQQRVVERRGEADALEDDLRAAERAGGEPGDDRQVLVDTVQRARETLAAGGLAVAPLTDAEAADDPARAAARVSEVFAGAVELLQRGGRVWSAPGAFFLPDGARTEGTLVHVGGVATFGIPTGGVPTGGSPAGGDAAGRAGALAPAGEGRLALWPADAAASARALLAGERPAPLRLFLYESLERPVEAEAPFRLDAWLDSGGEIAWVIVGLGALALLLVLARVVILARAGARTGRVLRRIEPDVRAGRPEAALRLVERGGGAAARVLRTVLANLGHGRETVEDLASEALLREAPRLERFGATIAVFATVAPLLGLLGTVTGMIATFDVITAHGNSDPKLLSGGISEALITTELGLIVAIPLLLVGTLLNGRAEAIQQQVERAALHVLNLAGMGTAARGADRDAGAAGDAAEGAAATGPDGAGAEPATADSDAPARRDAGGPDHDRGPRRPTPALGEA